MSLVKAEKLEVKMAGYAIGTSAALVDVSLQGTAQAYKREKASKLFALEERDIAHRFGSDEHHVSLKIDGEFSVLVYAEGEAILVNPGGTVRVGLPLLKEVIETFQAAGIRHATIFGELHYVRPDGKRARVHDVSRVARQPMSAEELNGLHFAPFDFESINGEVAAPDFRSNWDKLAKLFAQCQRIAVPEGLWVKDAAGIAKAYRKWVDAGAEGAVVRSEKAGSYKIKPRHNLDVVVIGYTESTEDHRKGMIHDLLLAVMRNDGYLHVLGHVGGGFSDEDRRAYLHELNEMIVASDYVEVNDQVAYHMVRPEIVIEISVFDLVTHSTRNVPMNRMVLQFDKTEQKYKNIRRLPLVALISPQYVRRREDKQVNKTDIRIEQVSSLVDVAYADRDAGQFELPISKVLRRLVYTKVLKAATMVRKFVMWQTNKQTEFDDFPAYVIHFTNYSPGRKTPLEREVRVSNSQEQIEELWKELLSENLAKGWEAVAESVSTAIAPVRATAIASTEATAVVESKPVEKKKPASKKADPVPEAAVPEAAPSEEPTAKKRAPRKKKTDDA